MQEADIGRCARARQQRERESVGKGESLIGRWIYMAMMGGEYVHDVVGLLITGVVRMPGKDVGWERRHIDYGSQMLTLVDRTEP